jgi:hypothetical protein
MTLLRKKPVTTFCLAGILSFCGFSGKHYGRSAFNTYLLAPGKAVR